MAARRRPEFGSRSLLAATLLLTWGAPAQASDTTGGVHFENTLSECVELTRPTVRSTQGMAVLRVQLRIKQPIAACGCKSALGSYTVSVRHEGYDSVVLVGKLSFTQSGRLHLPLAAHAPLVTNRTVEVLLACAPPD